MKQIVPYLDPLVMRKLKNIEIKAKMIVEGFITGMHKSPNHGFSVEFAEHRSYNTGDSLRDIDWKVYGKTDKLYLKKYEEETNLRCQVVLDVSDSMRYPLHEADRLSKLEYGAYLAAALHYLMIGQRDAAGLTLFDSAVTFYSRPNSKYSRMIPVFQKLEEVSKSTEYFTHQTAVASVLHEAALKFHRRSLVVIITDLFNHVDERAELFRSLQHLRHAKHEVLLFHLLDKKTEVNFDFPNRPMILKDLETGDKIEVNPRQIKEKYQAAVTAEFDEFKKKCHELNIDFVSVDVAQGYEKTLTDYLVKRRSIR
ncbi:MAG: DUF58 domain-containing protein [Bacteroidia bacterium]